MRVYFIVDILVLFGSLADRWDPDYAAAFVVVILQVELRGSPEEDKNCLPATQVMTWQYPPLNNGIIRMNSCP